MYSYTNNLLCTHAEAYVTLSECAEQKQELQEKIDESTKKIAVKRKQMEGLREELRVLGWLPPLLLILITHSSPSLSTPLPSHFPPSLSTPLPSFSFPLSLSLSISPLTPILGEEELQLKKKRDISYAKCSEIKKKLKSSREAQQQIAAFSSAKPAHSVS